MVKKKKYILLGAAAVVVLILIVAGILLLGNRPSSIDNAVDELEGFSLFDEENPNQGITLEEEGLTLDRIGTYTGAYVEDGSDEPISNVAAALFTNHSEQMLQIAEVEVELDGNQTAVFRITNVPAGKSVFAMAQDKVTCSKSTKAVYVSDVARFFEEVSLEEDRFDTEGVDGRLTLKNKTEETWSCVYVYYKTQLNKDVYLGGITYRVPFEEIPGETQIETDAGHYSPDTSEIVEVQILDNSTATQENEKEE